jgi:Na+-transporting methylmalonyl-CoA/oxaloacetate decarboxylase gamma subunit
MKRILQIFLFSGLMLAGLSLNAQSQSDMCINEYLVINTSDFEDDYGQHNGWIELFNSSYGTVNIAGCYLTNDPGNLTKYIIPKGDVLTKIKPRQHILFWADNQPFRGTFHINFKLEESEEILFVASDGRTIIDRIKIRKDLDSNVSFGRFNDGIGTRDGAEGWQIMSRTSPSTNNTGSDVESASTVFQRIDPFGAIMAFTAMTVVFIALILLYVVFKQIGRYNISKNRQRTEQVHGKDVAAKEEDVSAEIFAAISAAMHLHNMDSESHDIENTILTIARVTKNYSPWSSKIYTLRETPSKK